MKKLLLSKGIIIALSVVVISLFSYILYNSYATNTGIATGNNGSYTVLLTDSSNMVTVPAKSSKTIYYQFNNTNKGTVKYHIGYTSNTVAAKVWWDTKDPVSGTAAYGEYKFIKLKLINDTTEDDTITIKTVLGFENGGNVIADSNTTLITGTIAETNTMSTTPGSALSTLELTKATVEKIIFVDDNIVPEDALGSTNMNNTGTVKLWYFDEDENGLYEVYIGSENGITSFPSNSSTLFGSFTNMTSIQLDNISTLNVTNMGTTNVSGIFYNCTKLQSLDLRNFDVRNLQTMSGMFAGCTNLVSINIELFNAPSVTSMSALFYNCTNLTDIDLSRINTSNVTNMSEMFRGTKLSKISLDTSKCKNMSKMFMQSKATSLDLSTFDTSEVTTMESMFNGSTNLRTLNLNNFYTPKVTNTNRMFYNIPLRKLYLSNFVLGSTNVGEMFGSNNYLQVLDLRSADFSNTTSNTSVFPGGGSSKTATIYLKDTQGNRDLISNSYSAWTNIQFVS